MRGNFEACLAEVLRHEGGWSHHPKDPGGATMKGVTLKTYSKWLGREASLEELRTIPHAHLTKIYGAGYWDAIRGDELPQGVDLCLFDFAVNSGARRASLVAQTVAGVTPDGVLGPKSVAALQGGECSSLIGDICAARLAFLRGLPTWDTFGKGWTRRVNDVESKGRSMCATF